LTNHLWRIPWRQWYVTDPFDRFSSNDWSTLLNFRERTIELQKKNINSVIIKKWSLIRLFWRIVYKIIAYAIWTYIHHDVSCICRKVNDESCEWALEQNELEISSKWLCRSSVETLNFHRRSPVAQEHVSFTHPPVWKLPQKMSKPFTASLRLAAM
jgi:hypothetical protein